MPDKPLVFSFAEFEVREREFCIFKGSTSVSVEPRAFQVLLVLLRNPQKVITKDELLNTVWDDVEVTDNSLARSIVKLRQGLGDDARSPRFIETVAKVGYRFIHPVETRQERLEEADAPHRPEAANTDKAAEIPGVGSAQVLAWGQTGMRIAMWKGMTASAILLLVLVAGWPWHKHSREKWARESAEPEVARLLEAGDYPRAAALALQASAALPGDLTIKNLWLRATGEISIDTKPTAAEVYYRPYRGDPNAWTRLGKTPLVKIRLPQESYVFRVTMAGYAPEIFIGEPPGMLLVGDKQEFDVTLTLRASSSFPVEMVPVQGGWAGLNYPFLGAPGVEVQDFLIDRHEVTNEDFKRFVDAGGYQRQEYWKEPFVKEGRTLSWEQAMSRFHDTTGRPGPATWETGSYPNGHAQYPVAGVSWYEAMAYAAFAGTNLPTAYHWMVASEADDFTPLIAAGSNFHSEGTQPTGAPGALSGWGTTDMAGNVKEWCLNETWEHKRMILGGSYGEPDYMFNFSDAQSPWDRRPNFGFRCVKLDSPASIQSAQRIEGSVRDYWHEKPVSNEVFRAYGGLFSYDKTGLNARLSSII